MTFISIKNQIAKLLKEFSKLKYKKYIFMSIVLFYISIIFFVRKSSPPPTISVDVEDLKRCYSEYASSSDSDTIFGKEFLLDDVLSDSVKKPNPGKCMFAIVSTCSRNGSMLLNSRQACAIESAAKHNPNTDIFVLFVSPVHLNPHNVTPIIGALLKYSNIHFRNLNMWTFVKNTPLEDWFNQGEIFKSLYVMVHMSDMLRLLILYKYGGTYFDIDIVMKQSLENLEPNFAGAESTDLVENAILNFDSSGFGHDLITMCIIDFVTNFNGTLWSYNGPMLITRVFEKVCKTKSIQEMNRTNCKHLNVYNHETFFAIHYSLWKYFFEEEHFEEAMKMTNHSLSIHLWNKLSRDEKVKVGSRVAYGVLAEKNCPIVYGASGEYF